MNLSDNLKKIRKDNNLSQEQLAEKLGVSRQSVSKWESNQAYPEMDKMLQLCKIFNLNIDDLLNQDIKEVNNIKQAKNNINKYIDDFLDYITKTIDMFSSMKFREKFKCIFEQFIILGIIILIFTILGAIGSNIISSLFSFLPLNIYHFVFNIIEAIYLALSLVLGLILLLHIFKIRYLDYYIIIKEDKNLNNDDLKLKLVKDEVEDKAYLENNETKRVFLEKKKEKIIIRDPKHSGYKFISGLIRCLLFIVKTIAVFIAIMFCLSLILFVISLVISFLFIKTGLLFYGLLLLLISLIIINLIILVILYNFIISKKNKKGKLILLFVVSLIIMGAGSGLIPIGITNFDIITDLENENFITEETTMKMNDKLFFQNYYGSIKYIESDNNDIKIVYTYSKYHKIDLQQEGNGFYFYHYLNDSNIMMIVRDYIDNINDKKIIDYDQNQVYIYTSNDNIEKLKDNTEINLYD